MTLLITGRFGNIYKLCIPSLICALTIFTYIKYLIATFIITSFRVMCDTAIRSLFNKEYMEFIAFRYQTVLLWYTTCVSIDECTCLYRYTFIL